MFKTGEILKVNGRLIKVKGVRDLVEEPLSLKTMRKSDFDTVKRGRYLVRGITPNGEWHSYYPTAKGFGRPLFGRLRFRLIKMLG